VPSAEPSEGSHHNSCAEPAGLAGSEATREGLARPREARGRQGGRRVPSALGGTSQGSHYNSRAEPAGLAGSEATREGLGTL
jgi:hypothetical protein